MSASNLAMLLVYGGTLFLSAILVFLIQLILGKMITPLMGGTPEVWNTCMVFFQAMLLAGYAYAHLSTTYLGPRRQAQLHLGLMLLPLLFLFPIGVNKGFIHEGGNPISTVLLLLFFAVGIPFLVVSASAPMLQKWFSSTDHPAAADPYFLYGASNLGSMGVLFAYPTLIEPGMGISDQRWIWTGAYLLLMALTALCAYLMWTAPPAKPVPDLVDEDIADTNQTLSGQVTWMRRLRWILLAAVPSSLLLGSTTYMTTDIAPIPLLWVLPLALYLGTFIIVFSKTPGRIQDWLVGFFEPIFPGQGKSLRNVIDGHKALILTLPLLILLLVFLMMAEDVTKPAIQWLILLHMVTLFVVAMVCHGELARDRPPAKYLTEFFMWMSFGGVVGGLLNSLVAPVLFDGYYEYPLIMVLACMLLPHLSNESESAWGLILDFALAGLFLLVGCLLMVLRLVDDDLGFSGAKVENFSWHIIGAFLLITIGLWHLFRTGKERATRIMDLVLPVTLAILTVGLIWGLNSDYLTEAVLEKVDTDTGIAYKQSRLGRVTDWMNLAISWLGTPFNAQWEMSPRQFATILSFGLPAILCYTFVERSLRFGIGVAAILIAGSFCASLQSNTLEQRRGFFGVLKVEVSPFRWRANDTVYEERSHRLVHGTTLHGKQYYQTSYFDRALNEWVTVDTPNRNEPQTYYHLTGPIGQVCAAYADNPIGLGLAAGPLPGIYAYNTLETSNKLGVIGLGTGTMSAYARPGQTIVFYDIDPLVKKLSFDDDKYFSYVTDAKKRGANVVLHLNDARLAIERQVADLEQRARDEADSTGESYDKVLSRMRNAEGFKVLVVDAFSSDAIPIHLITLDAMKLYLRYMRDDGIVCFHISNRYLNLRPVLGNIVQKIRETTDDPNDKQLTGLYESDSEATRYNEHGRQTFAPANLEGKASSSWVMIARSPEALAKLYTDEQWQKEKKPLLEALPACAALPMPASLGMSGPAVCYTLGGFLQFASQYDGEQRKMAPPAGPWEPLKPDPKIGVWTDDYAPILRAFNWR